MQTVALVFSAVTMLLWLAVLGMDLLDFLADRVERRQSDRKKAA